MNTLDEIKALLQQKLKPTKLEVINEGHMHVGHAGAKQGGHFRVQIVSAHFVGKSRLEMHRMVYEAVLPVKSKIHALAIHASVG